MMTRLLFPLLLLLGSISWAQTEISKADLNMSLGKYSSICAKLIAQLPPADYRDAVPVPVTVDGKTPETYTSGMNCDAPSLLPKEMLGCDGPCTPFSRLLMLRNDAEAQIVIMFRRSIIRDLDNPLFDEIDLIMHSPINGATCWFQAKKDNPNCDPNIGVDGRNVPRPGSAKGKKFWHSPQEVAKDNCGECHDNDPFYYSPHVAQVREQLPANPFGLYSNAIGPFKQWKAPMSLEPRGSTCIGCHRIGSEFTCGTGIQEVVGNFHNQSQQAKSYPYSHWMPPENPLTAVQWQVRYREAVQLLLKCCEDPSGPECNQQPIPNKINN